VGGVVTTDAAVCTGINSGTLTLAGHTGVILRWESSVDNFAKIVIIANTTTTQSYTNLTQTTKYRAVVQNSTCAAVNSTPATITVNITHNLPTNVRINGITTPIVQCNTAPISLAADCTTGVLNWYKYSTEGTSVGTGSPLPTTPTVRTTTYYASCESVCLSARVASQTISICEDIISVQIGNWENNGT
jgi:hypothetical protein